MPEALTLESVQAVCLINNCFMHKERYPCWARDLELMHVNKETLEHRCLNCLSCDVVGKGLDIIKTVIVYCSGTDQYIHVFLHGTDFRCCNFFRNVR